VIGLIISRLKPNPLNRIGLTTTGITINFLPPERSFPFLQSLIYSFLQLGHLLSTDFNPSHQAKIPTKLKRLLTYTSRKATNVVAPATAAIVDEVEDPVDG